MNGVHALVPLAAPAASVRANDGSRQYQHRRKPRQCTLDRLHVATSFLSASSRFCVVDAGPGLLKGA